jgi:hypothetical protein
MRPSFSILGLSFTIHSISALAVPTIGPRELSSSDIAALKPRQNIDWSFSLYQNAQCTGAADGYSGAGDQGCTTGIRNGNAAAFIKRFIVPECQVIFFSDTVCNPNNAIDLLDEGTGTNCDTAAAGGAISSFQVDCP